MGYNETFTLVARMDSIRSVLSIVALKEWELHNMDVKSAFLQGDLEEEIYLKHPKRYIDDPFLVSRLKKSLYGLKESPRAWYTKMDAFLLSHKFERCKSECNVYM